VAAHERAASSSKKREGPQRNQPEPLAKKGEEGHSTTKGEGRQTFIGEKIPTKKSLPKSRDLSPHASSSQEKPTRGESKTTPTEEEGGRRKRRSPLFLSF